MGFGSFGMDCSHTFYCGAIAVVSVAVVGTVVTKLLNRKGVDSDKPANTVILHQMGRGPFTPSVSPFAIKLETYLRMAKMPYQNVHGFTKSPKGKFPWISFNGEVMGDSTLCIEYLNETQGLDLSSHLSTAERSVARSIRIMVDEHLYWCLIMFSWVFESGKTISKKTRKMGRILQWIIRKGLTKQSWAQGIGRHTEQEVAVFLGDDLEALSTFIGNKKFLFGNIPCEADCAVFGQLALLYCNEEGIGLGTTIKDQFPSLARYCERMKAEFWPDWDDCITHGYTRTATK